MAKPDPALLDPARYPFVGEIATRFSDLDTNQHVNNVALAGICEDSRVCFHKGSGYHAARAESGAMVLVSAARAIPIPDRFRTGVRRWMLQP